MKIEDVRAMTPDQLAYVAAHINTAIRWRFNWYRQVTLDRLKGLKIPDDTPVSIPFPVSAALPTKTPGPARSRP